MTLTKRWRILRAILRQQWQELTCAECGAKWMAEGKEHPELIRICDRCEVENLDAFMAFAEREYQAQLRKERRS